MREEQRCYGSSQWLLRKQHLCSLARSSLPRPNPPATHGCNQAPHAVGAAHTGWEGSFTEFEFLRSLRSLQSFGNHFHCQ